MTPTILLGRDRVAALGSPGGSRIITVVLLGLMNLMDGKSADPSQSGYVLGAFRRADVELLDKVLARAQDQIECWLDEGIGKAMSRYNGKIVLDENKNDKEKT